MGILDEGGLMRFLVAAAGAAVLVWGQTAFAEEVVPIRCSGTYYLDGETGAEHHQVSNIMRFTVPGGSPDQLGTGWGGQTQWVTLLFGQQSAEVTYDSLGVLVEARDSQSLLNSGAEWAVLPGSAEDPYLRMWLVEGSREVSAFLFYELEGRRLRQLVFRGSCERDAA